MPLKLHFFERKCSLPLKVASLWYPQLTYCLRNNIFNENKFKSEYVGTDIKRFLSLSVTAIHKREFSLRTKAHDSYQFPFRISRSVLTCMVCIHLYLEIFFLKSFKVLQLGGFKNLTDFVRHQQKPYYTRDERTAGKRNQKKQSVTLLYRKERGVGRLLIVPSSSVWKTEGK